MSKRYAYINAVFDVGKDYQIEVTRGGSVYVRDDGHLIRCETVEGPRGVSISAPDGSQYTYQRGKLVIHEGAQPRVVAPIREKAKA